MTVYLIDRMRSRMFKVVVLAGVTVFSLYYQYDRLTADNPGIAELNEYEQFIRDNERLISGGNLIVSYDSATFHDYAYYQAIKSKAVVWRYFTSYTGLTPHETFENAVSGVVRNKELCRRIIDFYKRTEGDYHPLYPKDGFLLAKGMKEFSEQKQVLENHGFEVDIATQDGDFILARLNRK